MYLLAHLFTHMLTFRSITRCVVYTIVWVVPGWSLAVFVFVVNWFGASWSALALDFLPAAGLVFLVSVVCLCVGSLHRVLITVAGVSPSFLSGAARWSYAFVLG